MKIIKFETATCTPCKMVDLMLKDKGLAVDEKIDIERDGAMAEKFTVMKVPTILLVDDNGNEVGRAMGIDEDGILNLFKQAGRM